jgi:hypothetical protein
MFEQIGWGHFKIKIPNETKSMFKQFLFMIQILMVIFSVENYQKNTVQK